MTPKDRRGNRYLINFVDYSTNYVRVFLAKNKVEATKKFEHFLVYFEKRFNCRIHVLRTDGGKEYINVDPFCKATGVRRQISERENQASNGKAERMHRTNETWKVAKKPPGAKCMHSKWVFKLKTHADGTIERYKARLVARGDEQEYRVDYTFTFSAVLEMVSGKVILVLSRIWKVPARHGDVPSAYVKAKKEAELVIMLLIPEGMEFTVDQLKALGVKSKCELVLIL
eukprot:jgi/Phyca11/97569/e_gw1.2.394.1